MMREFSLMAELLCLKIQWNPALVHNHPADIRSPIIIFKNSPFTAFLNLSSIKATVKVFWCKSGVNIARCALDRIGKGGALAVRNHGIDVWGADAAQPSVTASEITGANRSTEHIQLKLIESLPSAPDIRLISRVFNYVSGDWGTESLSGVGNEIRVLKTHFWGGAVMVRCF